MSSRTLYAPQPKRPRPSHLSRAGPSSVLGTSSSNSSYSSRSVELPYDLIEYIFTLLPIIYTVRAGLVAKRFKDTWLLSRRLHFERDLGFQHDAAHFYDIINHVFLHHKGPEIKSFRVFVDPKDIEFFLSTWVDNCIEKGVDELQLDIYQTIKWQPHFPAPRKFFHIETLRVFHMSNSVVHLPPQLNGLSLLTTLVLKDVIVQSREIEAIIDHCSMLETLDMAQCYGFRTLRILAEKHRRFRVFKLGGCGSEVAGIFINAPTLRCLYYDGNLCNLGFHVFKPMLRMHEAILNFAPSRVFTNPWQIERIVSQICNVKIFTINSTFLEGLAPRIVDGQFKQMEFAFGNLKELQLILDNTSFCNLGDITFFLKNCPNIEKLFIEANDKFIFHEGPYWELHQDLMVMKNYFGFFNNIKVIKINGFQFQIHFMELVKFLLGKAMFLESMVLVLPNNLRFTSPRYMDYFGNLLNSWRVSYQGQISIYFAYDDRSGVEPQQSKMWYR